VNSLRRSAESGRRRVLRIVGLSAALAAALSLTRTAGAQPAAARRFDLRIAKRRVADGATTIRVAQGEMVELHWTTDEPAILHLHGYDIEVAVEPAAPAVMRVHAHATGRFPITVHAFGKQEGKGQHDGHREVTLAYLEAHPR